MSLAWNVLVGNGISFIAGIFLIISYCVNDVKKAYKYQFLNAFILAISSVFFFSWTGVVTMLIAASRNIFVYYDKLTKYWTVFFLLITVVLGIYVKKKGKEVNSDSLVASGSDAFNDAILSISVLVSAIIYMIFKINSTPINC